MAATGWTEDDGQPMLGMHIRNDSGKTLYLGCENASVNDYMMDFYMVSFHEGGGDYLSSIEIPANSDSTDYGILLNQVNLEDAGIDTIANFEGVFTLSEEEYGEPLFVSDIIVIPNPDNEGYEQSYNEEGTVAVDNDLVKIVVAGQDHDEFFGPTVTIYVCNKSDEGILVLPKDVTVNGVDAEMYYSAEVMPGKHSVAFGSFEGEGIKEMESLREMTIGFDVMQWDGMEISDEVILSVDPVTAQFD